jgi:hypothetical protein
MGKRDTYFGILAKARIIVIAFGATLLLAITSADANTLTVSDHQKMTSLGKALRSARTDILEATEKADSSVAGCLLNVHNIASYVDDKVSAIHTLVYLAVLMKEATDEILVLEQLHIFLDLAKEYLPKGRKRINSEMSRCAAFAVVTVKGQAVLNTFPQLDEQVTSLLNRIGPVLPPRTR